MFRKDQLPFVFNTVFALFFSFALTAFLSSIPATFAFAYVVAVLFCPLPEKLTHHLCAKE